MCCSTTYEYTLFSFFLLSCMVYFTFSSDVAVWSGKVVLSRNFRLLVSHWWECCINCFLWAGGFPYYRRGAAEISVTVLFLIIFWRYSEFLVGDHKFLAVRVLEWCLGNRVPLEGTRRLPRVDPLPGSGRDRNIG